MLRGSSISIVKPGDRQLSGYNAKSWAELATFFDREKNAEGRQYKKDIPKQIQEYRGWVFSAIDCIVDRMCSINIGFYKVSNDERIKNPQSGGLAIQAIAKPILHPNDYMSFDFVLQWCQTQLDLCGKAAILKLPNALGKTWELWPMDMNYFEGVEKGESYLSPPKGFKFRMDNKVYLFPPSRIIWLRYAHPEDLWDGFSPIQAQAYTTDIEYYMEVYERSFFRNSARVDFVIQAEGNVDEGEAQRIKETWIQKYGGIQKSYEPAVLSGGLKVVPITMSNADFQFLELAKWTKERILAAYRVPEGKLGLFADINRANQRGIDIAFNEECYSEDTEFLTSDGWKDINNYNGEKVATVNPDTDYIEYCYPNKTIIRNHSGKMIHFNTKQIDMLVTPGHNIWYSRQTGIGWKQPRLVNGKLTKWVTAFTPWGFDEAKDLKFNGNGIGAKRTYVINPPVYYDNENNIEKVIIPELPRDGNRFINKKYETPNKEYEIDGDLWFEFLGYYLSEGGLATDRYSITISQHMKSCDKIADCLSKLPFHIGVHITGNFNGERTIIKFYITNKSLWEYLLNECGVDCDKKRVPDIIIKASARQKKIFLDALFFGDGTKNRGKNARNHSSEYSNYNSTSKRLIEQVAIMAMELGYKVGFGKYCREKPSNDLYRVNLTRMHYSSIRAFQIKELDYDGKVWCFNVPNHLFITRRNGKVAVQGNCIKPRLKLWQVELNKQLIGEYTNKS